MNIYLHGADVLGGELVGMIDIADAQRKMNALKPVTVRVAKALLRGGQEAIEGALKGAKRPFYQADLPGGTARDNVKWKLKWHADHIAPVAGDPNRLYDAGDDLKKWTMQAFVEANAVEEGAAYLDEAWSAMWAEIGAALAALPAEVRQALAKAVSGTVEAVTGLPLWAWGLIAAGGTALLGFAAYKIANTRAGGAVAGVAARRWIG